MARLLALSDLHINYPANRAALAELPAFPDDWLIVAGDVGDEPEDLRNAFALLCRRFARLVWVPGNHELWDRRDSGLRGVARYQALVETCRGFGVCTPEDPPLRWDGAGGPALIVPLFVGYDLSFRPDDVPFHRVVEWAAEGGILPTDDRVLPCDPYPNMAAWCAARIALSEARLMAASAAGLPLVLVNHYPLRAELIRFGRIARYLPWCGTRATEDWHRRFPVKVAVHGHLHMRATDWRDGVRFEEVALGYPRHWRPEKGPAGYLREILPGPPPPPGGHGGPEWWF